MAVNFTESELRYLRGQRLGRLATVDRAGAPQNNPVGYFLDMDAGQVLVAGTALAGTRKFRNVERNENVSLVVDDLASTDPWVVRGVEVRGTAAAVRDVDPPAGGLSRELIRITPRWIGSWGLDPGRAGLTARGRQADVPSVLPPSGGPEGAEVTEVRWLVDAYFAGFDRRAQQPGWLAAIFTEDVDARFPVGAGHGLAELAELTARGSGPWSATLHQTSNHQVTRTERGAEFTAALTATHVHRPEHPGAHLRIGARVHGAAVRRDQRWYLSDLAVDLVWSEGDGPGGRDVRAGRD